MAIGDDAAAAGMALVNGAATAAANIDQEINRTRDYIAQRTNEITPVVKGGTGASTASGARTNLDVPSRAETVLNGDSGNAIRLTRSGDRVKLRLAGTDRGDIAYVADVDGARADANSGISGANSNANGRVSKGGDTMTGQLLLPNSFAASSSWTVCYINGDGRVSRGSSSQRYKKYIHDAPDLGDLFAAPLREYRMRTDGVIPDDGVKHIGYVAEELVGTDMERFVVVINDQVESIDFIALLMAQVSQLNARVAALEGS